MNPYEILVVEGIDNIMLSATIMAEDRRDAYLRTLNLIPNPKSIDVENTEIMLREFLPSTCPTTEKFKIFITGFNEIWNSTSTLKDMEFNYDNKVELPNRMLLIDVLALKNDDKL
jgi:hypothetical protein